MGRERLKLILKGDKEAIKQMRREARLKNDFRYQRIISSIGGSDNLFVMTWNDHLGNFEHGTVTNRDTGKSMSITYWDYQKYFKSNQKNVIDWRK